MKYTCKICGATYDKFMSFIVHLQFKHKDITAQEYYDRYLKKEGEGFCKMCGKPTRFDSIKHGYKIYCTKKCAWQDPEVKAKRKAITDNFTEEQKKEWHDKRKATINARYNGNISVKDTESRLNRSISHFSEYLNKCNCTFLAYKDKRVYWHCNTCNNDNSCVRSLLDRMARNKDYNLCFDCYSRYSSKIEQEISEYIKTLTPARIFQNDHTLIKKELDILIPDYKLAIEVDGLYWHNENCVDSYYHVAKTNCCEEHGYQLLHIFEDEWTLKKDIVKSRIASILGVNHKIYARKCEIKEVTSKEASEFLDNNHLQGKCSSKYKYGLYYKGELVSLMTFGKSRFANEFELLRFCNKLYTNVIGGASRLLAHFRKDHPEIKKIISYADRRWSTGKVYEALGFTKVHVTNPSYFYIINRERHNRIKFQKHKLVAKGADPAKTEHEIMQELGFSRIYDCGTIKYCME